MQLAQFLKSVQDIPKVFDFSDCQIVERDFKKIGEVIGTKKELDIRFGKSKFLLPGIEFTSNGYCILGPSLLRTFFQNINSNILKTLGLSNNSLGSEGAQIIAVFVLRGDIKLRQLDLSSNAIGNDGCAAILHSMIQNTSIDRLDISDNNINEEGVVDFTVLDRNRTLFEINLSNNPLGAQGTKFLSAYISKTVSLGKLQLNSINMKEEGAFELIEALKKNRSLGEIQLRGNDLSSVAVSKFGEVLSWNHSLVVLDIGREEISDGHAQALLNSLSTNFSILKGIFEIGADAIQQKPSALLERNQGLYKQLFTACEEGPLPALIRLIQLLKISPHCSTATMDTPLHIATTSGQAEFVEFLINNGAHVNARNSKGETPHDIAISSKNTNIARILELSQTSEVSEEGELDFDFHLPSSAAESRSNGSITTDDLNSL